MTRREAYLIAGLTVLATAGVLSGFRPATIAGGLLLAFALPGAALGAVLFRDRATLAAVERIVLVPVLSMGTLVLGGLAGWALGAPLYRTTWLVVSAAVALLGVLVAGLRPAVAAAAPVPAAPGVRVKLPTAGDTTLVLPVFLDREGILEPPPLGLRARVVRHAVPLALAVVLLGGAAWLSMASSIRTHDAPVTALSADPPAPADASGRRAVAVRASGLTAGPDAYTLVVTTAAGLPHSRYPVTADARGDWAATLQLPGTERLTLGLYRAGRPDAVRTVIIAAR